MPEESAIAISAHCLPTELLIYIFFTLSPKDLMKCRQICTRWKYIIDSLAKNETLWQKFCKRDFKNYYWTGMRKACRGFSWYHLYRSLSMWPRLPYASEKSDEFASASRLLDEVRSVDIIGNGIIAVHKKGAIEYYDIETLKPSKRGGISGDYARYTENDNYIVIQSYHLHLFVIRKVLHDKIKDLKSSTFDNVKMFLLTDFELYYVKLNDEIYVCNLKNEPIASKFIKRAEDLDGVMSLGYNNGCLNVLTYQRNIYTIVDNKDMVYKQSLNSEPNILNVLNNYNFLEQLDWRVYFQWMYVLNHSLPEGPMRDIIIIRPYGDLYFVGSNFGVLCIFHEPYINGELDLFNSEPLRQVNFMDRSDIPVLATCPILQIDVQETETGHTVFVAMPKKVAVLKYTHSYMRPPSWAIEPYNEVHRAQFLNVENDTTL